MTGAPVTFLVNPPRLERAGIHPWAWVINNSVAAARPRSPFLRQRPLAEVDQIEAAARYADRIALIPLLADGPVGEARLAGLAEPTPVPATAEGR